MSTAARPQYAPPRPLTPHARRTLAQRQDDARRLIARSWEILRSWLVDRYGLGLTEDHETVLRAMLREFALLTCGFRTGRYAFPLLPGAGKSQAILAHIAALHDLNLPYPVMVAASRAASLCEMVTDLERNTGMGEGVWSLLHSVSSAPRPASASPLDAPYLFTTHARMRQRKEAGIGKKAQASFREIQDLATWVNPLTGEAQPRMIFYDESFFVSDVWSIQRRNLFASIAGLRYLVEGLRAEERTVTLRQDAVAFLEESLPLLQAELEAQATAREAKVERAPQVVYLPERTEGQLDAYKRALKDVPGVHESVFDLLDIAQAEIRAVLSPGISGGAYVSYHVAIPSCLDRVAVTDASYLVRVLCHADTSLKPADVPSDLTVKRYTEDNKLYILKAGGGRRGIEKSARGDRKTYQEAVQIIKQHIPDTGDEQGHVLVFTYKDKPTNSRYHVSVSGLLYRMLEEAEVPNARERVHIITYGNETGSNAYRNIPSAILLGVMERSAEDLYSSFIAQSFEWSKIVPPEQIEQLKVSESTHVAFQAMHRTTMRKMRDGKSLPSRTWIFYQDPRALFKGLHALMPGLTLSRWQNYALPTFEEVIASLTEKIVKHLDALPVSVTELRPSDVHRAVCPNTRPMTFHHALSVALKQRPVWERSGYGKGQKLIRQAVHI